MIHIDTSSYNLLVSPKWPSGSSSSTLSAPQYSPGGAGGAPSHCLSCSTPGSIVHSRTLAFLSVVLHIRASLAAIANICQKPTRLTPHVALMRAQFVHNDRQLHHDEAFITSTCLHPCKRSQPFSFVCKKANIISPSRRRRRHLCMERRPLWSSKSKQ